MSNLERDPAELICEVETPDVPGTAVFTDAVSASVTDVATSASTVEILTARDVPLGGPRAMRVRRTLPQRGRPTIGAWCFADHYGPDEVDRPAAWSSRRTRTPACRR